MSTYEDEPTYDRARDATAQITTCTGICGSETTACHKVGLEQVPGNAAAFSASTVTPFRRSFMQAINDPAEHRLIIMPLVCPRCLHLSEAEPNGLGKLRVVLVDRSDALALFDGCGEVGISA